MTYRVKILTLAKLEKYDKNRNDWITVTKPLGVSLVVTEEVFLDENKEIAMDIMSESLECIYDGVIRLFKPVMKKNEK